MEPLNYTSTRIAFWGACFFIMTACGSDPKKSSASDSAATSTSASTTSKKSIDQNVEQGDFVLMDTMIRTSIAKQIKLCMPISTPIENPNFTVVTTNPSRYGTMTPSVSGKILCLDYNPKTGFEGLDQFDCKVCLTSTGYCQEKTWYVEVKNEIGKEIAKSVEQPSISPTAKTVKKKVEPMIEAPPPSSPTRSSIFDPEKKNNDGYVPKNDN